MTLVTFAGAANFTNAQFYILDSSNVTTYTNSFGTTKSESISQWLLYGNISDRGLLADMTGIVIEIRADMKALIFRMDWANMFILWLTGKSDQGNERRSGSSDYRHCQFMTATIKNPWFTCTRTRNSHTHIEVRDGKRTAAAISLGDSTLDNSNPYIVTGCLRWVFGLLI